VLVINDQLLDVDDGLTIGTRRNGNAILHLGCRRRPFV
jgi:hypothetical protein